MHVIPNTAVFCPNNFIETATTSTAQYYGTDDYGTDDSLWISKWMKI